MNLTSDQLHTLRHMLGINTPWDKEPKPYRNYAAVNLGDPKYLELERLGAVKNLGKSSISEYDCYVCTEEGKNAAILSHKTIRYSKSKRRYLAFLKLRDGFSDIDFKQFLSDPYFKEVRETA